MKDKPNIQRSSTNWNSTVKLLKGESYEIRFRVDSDKFDYDVWTDINTGKFRSESPIKFEDNGYRLILECESTGFFSAVIRYKSKEEKKYTESEINYIFHIDPDWIVNTITYNIFLRSFGSSQTDEKINPGENGTFEDVIRNIDKLKDLGINAIYLNPFHVIGDLYRKYNPSDHLPYYLQPGSPYSIKDPKSIDPEVAFAHNKKENLILDPKKQFQKLVDAAHRRGMRVILDLVFNHTSHDFILQKIFPEWFLYKENITSPDDPYLYPEDVKHGKPWGDAKHTVVPYDHGTFSWTDAAQLNWEYMLPPAPNAPPTNTKKKEMYEYFKSIPKYWVEEFGVDGFRCDVAYKVPSDFWLQCIQETKEVAKKCFPHNKSIDGEVIFIAESFHINLKELFEAGFTLVYGDYSNKLLKPVHLKGYLDYIYNLSAKDYPAGAKWFIFPECHDFHRITSKLVQSHIANEDGWNVSEKEEAAIRGNISRWVLSATLPGMPMVFNGFEKVEWEQVDHVSYSVIDWKNAKDITQQIREVNNIRHNFVSLQKGSYTPLETSQGMKENTQILSFVRYYNDETIIIVTNMDIHNSASAYIHLTKIGHFDPEGPFILKDLLTKKIFHRKDKDLYVEIEPGDSHIFLVEQNWGE